MSRTNGRRDDDELRSYRAQLVEAYNAAIDMSRRHPTHPARLAELLREVGLPHNVQHLVAVLGAPEGAGREV